MGNIGKIQEKMEKPIEIILGKYSNCIEKDETCEKRYPLCPGTMIAEGHYGFIIKIEGEDSEKRDDYFTTSSVVGVQLDKEKGILIVHERDMQFPWTFDAKTGKLIQRSTFAPTLNDSIGIATYKYGIKPELNPEYFGRDAYIEYTESKNGRSGR